MMAKEIKQRIQLKQEGYGSLRFLSGPHINLGETEKKTTTITVLRTGSFAHSQYGRFQINKALFEGMLKNFNANTYGQQIFMDVSHEPEKGSAGHIQKLFIAGDRLRAEIAWTEYGIDSIKKRGFKYISADFIENYTDNELEQEHGPVLFGAALVTRPHIKNMEAVQLSEDDKNLTLIHQKTMDHLITQRDKTMKKILAALRKKLEEMGLASGVILQLVAMYEAMAKQLADDEIGLQLLSDNISASALKLKEAIGDKNEPITFNLGDIKTGTQLSADDLDALVVKKLAEATAKKTADDKTAKASLDSLHKKFNEAIDGAEGLSDETVKTLKEAEHLIIIGMTEDQVNKLALSQISLGNQIENSKKLGSIGYQTAGAAGTVHIELGQDTTALQLQESINTGLGNSNSARTLALTEDKKLNPFARKVLAVFDHLNARQLHEENMRLSGGETSTSDTNFPIGVQRTVIREALSDLRILELVQTLTDPSAKSTTDIPYESRDISQVINDGLVFEGQSIPGASISQEMDMAFVLPRKLAMSLTNEVIHFSRSSDINWDAYARNVQSNVRVMRELIARVIANEYQRAADAYNAIDIVDEDIAGQLGGANSTIKTAQYPIVRMHQDRNLKGTAIGNPENKMTLVISGATITPYDGSNKQSSGTYYRITNYNLGYILLVTELGVPTTPSSANATLSYSYATNIAKFDIDIPNGSTLAKHYNGLLQKIGGRKALLQSDRYVMPDFLLMSATLNDSCTNAEQFTASGKRVDANVSAAGDLESVKSTPAFATNAPGIDLGDERILMGQRNTCTYTIVKPFVTGTPFEAVGPDGQPVGKKVAYGEEYSSMKVPTQIRGRLTSVIAFSFSGR